MAGYRYRRPPPGPSRRLPYGHRPDSCDVLGDSRIEALNADWFPGARSIPMPRNRGSRWLVRCPKCQTWRKTLYRPMGVVPLRDPYAPTPISQHPFPHLTDFWWCRRCWGLRYPSEYQLRRPEAGGLWDTSRLDALLDSAFRARSPAVGERRLARFATAMATRDQRELAFVRRLGASTDRLIAAWDASDRAQERRTLADLGKFGPARGVAGR